MHTIEKKYFASANGYQGFRSYFDKIFISSEYNKIFVIKGGPGTGKSSFMRSIGASLQQDDIELEYIYCSSDPKSLDGLIIRKDNIKIALLDGTAPHERDAIIPGAIDEIINLGEGLDTNFLYAKKEEILSLNDEKRKAYKTAYSYLDLAGQTEKYETEKLVWDNKKIKSFLSDLKEHTNGNKTENESEIRLISSFGKNGIYSFNTLENIADKTFAIEGDDPAVYNFMNILLQELKADNAKVLRYPHPLEDKMTDAIYIPDTKTAFVVRGNGEKIYIENFILSKEKTDKERRRRFSQIKEDALLESIRWFSIASDFHFRLENIYSSCMNFEVNDKLLLQKNEQIGNLLGL